MTRPQGYTVTLEMGKRELAPRTRALSVAALQLFMVPTNQRKPKFPQGWRSHPAASEDIAALGAFQSAARRVVPCVSERALFWVFEL